MVQPAYSTLIQVTIDGKPLPPDYAPMLVDGWVDQGAGVPPRSGSPSGTRTGRSSPSLASGSGPRSCSPRSPTARVPPIRC